MDISEATVLIQQQTLAINLLQERLSTLEVAIPGVGNGWERISGSSGADFERSKLQDLADWAKIYWLKNPLIRRAVEIQVMYVWASGYNVNGDAPEVDKVITKLWDDPKNSPVLSHQGLENLERELRLNGNLFFTFFTNITTGRVLVRTFSFSEIREIITDPEDRQTPWFYLRSYTEQWETGPVIKREYYPDWRYNPKIKPVKFRGLLVNWDIPVMHVKTNCLSDMIWGVSEVYTALDWSKGYKEFLEDWMKLVKAYSRFAWNATVKGGASAVTAATTSLEQMLNPDPNGEPVTAGIFVGNQNTQMQPYKFSGATTAVDDSRRYMLMVGSATGTPEHLLAADPSTSNLATSKTLERPSELQYQDRQRLWAEVLQNICQYVIDQAAMATRGLLDGDTEEDEYGDEIIVLKGKDKNGNSVALSRKISITFPEIVEHDLNEQIQAVIDTATLKGQSLAGTLDLKTITRLLIRILKVDDADDLLLKLFPTDDLIMHRAGGNSGVPAGSEGNSQDQDPGILPDPGDPKIDPSLDQAQESHLDRLDREIAAALNQMQGVLNAADPIP